MNIYPTYLYIKKHKITGLKYFGKTTKNNVESYNGSGVYWKNHIKKYGKKHIETLWVSEPFYDKNLLVEFSTFFSDFFDIENSSKWANLIIENGLDGAPKGVKNSGPFGELNGMFGKTKEQNPFYNKKHNPDQIKSWSDMRLGDKNPNYQGKSFTEETYRKLRQPKKCKDNYKGSPGKICVINKNGEAIQITTEIYNRQKDSGLPMEQWEFVSTTSKVAKIRRTGNNFKYT